MPFSSKNKTIIKEGLWIAILPIIKMHMASLEEKESPLKNRDFCSFRNGKKSGFS